MVIEHRKVVREINGATEALVESGLADDQNQAYESQVGTNNYLVLYGQRRALGWARRNTPYDYTYHEFRQARSFNVLMLDGAMMQMEYEFRERAPRAPSAGVPALTRPAGVPEQP